eukprot:1160269-Pelagomonas_calceolata.AAC.12
MGGATQAYSGESIAGIQWEEHRRHTVGRTLQAYCGESIAGKQWGEHCRHTVGRALQAYRGESVAGKQWGEHCRHTVQIVTVLETHSRRAGRVHARDKGRMRRVLT